MKTYEILVQKIAKKLQAYISQSEISEQIRICFGIVNAHIRKTTR